MNIQDIRRKYPQYNDLSDQVLADGFHKKFYSDIPKNDFYSKIGLKTEPSRLSKIGTLVNKAITSGDFTPAEEGNGVIAGNFMRTGANLSTGIPMSILGGVAGVGQLLDPTESTDRNLQQANQAIERIGGALRIKPKNNEDAIAEENIGEALMKPITMSGEGWQDIVKQTPLKGTMAEPIANIIGQASAIFGTGKLGKTVEARVNAVKNSTFYRQLTIPERSLVVQSLDDIMKSGMSEAEAVRKYPNLFQEALNKRSVTPTETIGTIQPQETIPGEILSLPEKTIRNGRRGRVKIRPVPPENMILRQAPPVVDVPNFEEPIDTAPIEKVEPTAITEGKTLPKQGLSAEMKSADEILQMKKDIIAGGGLNRASMIEMFGKDTVNDLDTIHPKLINTNGTLEIDKYAQDKGLDAETLKNNLLDYKKTSITKAKEIKYLKERYYAELKAAEIDPGEIEESRGDIGAALETKGYSPEEIASALEELAEERAAIQEEDSFRGVKESLQDILKDRVVKKVGENFVLKVTPEEIKEARESGQWWVGRDFQKEIEAATRPYEDGTPRISHDPIRDGYVPITYDEQIYLADKFPRSTAQFDLKPHSEMTGDEGLFMRKPDSYAKQEQRKLYREYEDRYYGIKDIPGTRGNIALEKEVPDRTGIQNEGIAEKKEKLIDSRQTTIPGTSEAENFSLDNPETDWSKSKPLSEQTKPKNEDFQLNSGLDITQTIDVLKGLTSNIKEALPHLETIGRNVYGGGKKTYSEWRGQMQTHLGDLWESFKDHLKAIWDQIKKTIGNEKGAVGEDINDPIIKQREIKGKDKETRTAPAIRKSEFEALRDMPELRQKPLGGWIENPIRTFEELGPQIKEIFYRPVKEAEHAAKIQFQKIHEQSEKLRKSLPSKSSERIGIFAIFKQSGGEEILAKMGIKDIPELSPREMKVYEWMRKGLETYYNKLQEARAAAGKEKFGHVEDYFTFARQMTLIEQLGFSPIFSREKLLSNFMHRKTTPFRFEKHRVGGLSRADLDAFGVFNRYMESATRHVNLSPAIAKGREMMNTFKDVDGENWILRDDKPSAAKFITEWLDFQAGQRKPQLPNFIEKGLTKLNKNLAFSILSANIRSALIQPTAIVNTAAEIGPKWTYAGIKSILDNSGMEKSNVLFSRQFDVNVSESLAGLPGKIGQAKQVIGNLGMKPLQFLDMQTAKATWNGAYKKALSEHMAEREAINYADDVVTKTQGSAMPSDLAPIQRTALGKAISMFQTFVINQWGFLTRDVLGIKNANINNNMMFKKVAAFVVGSTLFNILYEDILGIPSPMPSPINAFVKSMEKDDDMPSASLDAALEIAQLVPVVGGGLRYGSSMLGAPAEYIGDIGKKIS
ncbi:MAG: hypothetical protein PHS34_08990, partial [Candidatus Omnitrophica bacterium]|nr:hypothetical protein [Candidatus Omnitrophota bacterium]